MVKRFPLIPLSMCFVSLLVAAGALLATDFYVAPNASGSGTGSFSSPWKLQTALNQPGAVHPGDTIWLRGGTYSGAFTSNLDGSATNPIIVRQYTSERATIDGKGNSNPALVAAGSYTWFWGFEVTNSDTSRPHVDFSRPSGVVIDQDSSHPGLKFINLVVHDTGTGFGFWTQATDSEISGCLIYYNGNTQLDHGIYAQNQTGTKKIFNNILFNNYGHGIQIYGSSSAHLDGFDLEGNTSFNNGLLSSGTRQRNLLLGGDAVAKNPIVKNNYLYYLPGGPTSAFDLGYSAGCSNATVTNNYSAGNTEFKNCLPVSMTGNTFYGSTSGFSQSQYPNNTYLSNRPTGTKTFIRANAYEAGRANITIYNWGLATSVDVDLTGILAVGTAYEIRNAEDFFGAALLTGTYAGGSVTVSTGGLSVDAPVGFAAPNPTGREFNAFVLLPILGVPPPTPTKTPKTTNTPTRTPTHRRK